MKLELPTTHIRKKKNWLFLGSIIASLVISEALLYHWSSRQEHARWQQVQEEASQARSILESELIAATAIASGISIYVYAREGDINPVDIERMLETLFLRGPYFRNIGLAPDNRIDFVYPMAGNESVLGFQYEEAPDQWIIIQEIINLNEGRLAGPLDLVQGGTAFLYREPIFIGDEYWGLLSTVMNVDYFLDILAPLQSDPGINISLRGKDALGEQGEVFWGNPSVFTNPSTTLDIFVPGGSWQLAISLDRGHLGVTPIMRAASWAATLLVLFILFAITRAWFQRETLDKMERLVDERTRYLAESKGLLSSVLDAAQEFSIIATDTKGRVTLFNKGAERMLGYTANEIVNRYTPEILHLPDELATRAARIEQSTGRSMSPLSAVVHQARQGQQDISEWTYRRKDGSTLPVLLVTSPITGTNEQLVGFLGIATDMTERKRIDRLKNEFVATVSHELRTPLTSITGALALLHHKTETTLPEEARSMLHMAERNTKRLGALINDLLDVSKIEAGMLDIKPSSQKIVSVVQDTIKLHKGFADQFGIKLCLEPGYPDPSVQIDKGRMQQILGNLLSNAIKFSPPESEVVVSIHRIDQWVRVIIEDSGIGIPEEFRPKLFDKFTQADSSSTRSQGGTGLGLSICLELIQQMSGKIDFYSEEGKGSQFWVDLPEDSNES